MAKSRAGRQTGQLAYPSLPTRVPEVLRALARWAVGVSMGLAPACAGREEGWEPIGCTSSELPALLRGSDLGALDYAGIYREYPGGPPSSVEEALSNVQMEAGTRCANAAAPAACSERFDELAKPSADCGDGRGCGFLLTTQGDDVTRGGRGALLDLLGPVDAPDKATLLALFDGYTVSCPVSEPPALRGTETRAVDDGFEVRTEFEDCGVGYFQQTLEVSSDGKLSERSKVKIKEDSNCTIGRRPEGLCAAPELTGAFTLGTWLARAARLEAASVYAFERLARELHALHAPDALIASALRSASDEVRHTHAMTALARRFGAEPIAPLIADLPERTPALIALENAVEGCVRETYGALLAHHQAQTALDPDVRAVMRVIAEDETRHATLSWQVAHWLEPQLPAGAQRAIASARGAAWVQLRDEVEPRFSAADARAIGWPAPQVEHAMIANLERLIGGDGQV